MDKLFYNDFSWDGRIEADNGRVEKILQYVAPGTYALKVKGTIGLQTITKTKEIEIMNATNVPVISGLMGILPSIL